MPILRAPTVITARKTIELMAFSLAFLVLGLMISYALYNVRISSHKTLNAVLFDTVTANWGSFWSRSFIFTILVSEAALLFVAAQTGFIDGPRIMANMALDRWFPKKYASLSNWLVTMNGVLLMGISAIVLMAITKGSVGLLVVLYSINVFITFSISQFGHGKALVAGTPQTGSLETKTDDQRGWLYSHFLHPGFSNPDKIQGRRLDHIAYHRPVYNSCS